MTRGEIKYLGWTIYRWASGGYGIWYPNGENTGRQYPSLAKAKQHIKAVEAIGQEYLDKVATRY